MRTLTYIYLPIISAFGFVSSCDNSSDAESLVKDSGKPEQHLRSASPHSNQISNADQEFKVSERQQGIGDDASPNEVVEFLLTSKNLDNLDMKNYSGNLVKSMKGCSLDDFIGFINHNSEKLGNLHLLSKAMVSKISRSDAASIMKLRNDPEILAFLDVEARDIPSLVARGLLEGAGDNAYDLAETIESLNYDDSNILDVPDGFFMANPTTVTDFRELSGVIDLIHNNFPDADGALDHMVLYAATRHPTETIDYLNSQDLKISEHTLLGISQSYFRVNPIAALNYAASWPNSETRSKVLDDLAGRLKRENPGEFQRWRNSRPEGN